MSKSKHLYSYPLYYVVKERDDFRWLWRSGTTCTHPEHRSETL